MRVAPAGALRRAEQQVRPTVRYCGRSPVNQPDRYEMMLIREEGVQDAEEFRGQFFTDLDRLAFALEMEGVERLAAGDRDAALRLENQRLGVRLAQRLAAGIWADEVHARIQRWRVEYESRLELGEKAEAR